MFFPRSAFKIVGLFLILALSGCSIYSLPGGEPAPIEESEPEYTPATPPPATKPSPPPVDSVTTDSSAFRSLVDKADRASADGDFEQALAYLERAQRIDPGDGTLYLKLAQTYSAKGDNELAAATAERGMLYCSGSAECNALRAFIR